MLDPFKDGFSLAQLSQAINVLPNMYSRVASLNLFKWRPQSGKTASIEMRNGVLRLVPTTPWGGVPPKNQSGRSNIRSFNIPHMPIEDTVHAADVIGVRQFGTDGTLTAIAQRVNDKLQEMKNKIDQTMEWRMLGALRGVVLDYDGSVIEDYFTAFGITKKSIDFALDDPDTDVRAKCVEVLRWQEDHLQGEAMSGSRALVSPEFFDALITHPKVTAVYQGWAEAANKLGGDLRKGFTFGGVTFEEYRAVVDGQRFIAAGAGHAFPLGTSETFSNYGAPADFVETVNTIALPYYARQQNKDFNRGIDLHAQSNILPMVTRPATIVELLA